MLGDIIILMFIVLGVILVLWVKCPYSGRYKLRYLGVKGHESATYFQIDTHTQIYTYVYMYVHKEGDKQN